MLSWIARIFKNKEQLTTSTEEQTKQNDPESSPGLWFGTHAILTKARREEIFSRAFQITPDDFQIADSGMDDNSNTDSAKGVFRLGLGRQIIPDKLFSWYVSQTFIGYQACALISQNWLVNRACSLKGRDAVRNGFNIIFDDGIEVPPELKERIERLDRKFKLKANLVQADKFKNVFGIRHVLFVVDSEDPDYYEKPFNPDGITPGSYKGIAQIDPYWLSPLLTTDAVEDPESIHFYEPTYWNISGRKYHRSHFVILRGAEVPDVLKPSYLYGGLPLTQLIMERVYAAERTANEAPQLALTKRLVIRYVENLSKAMAQIDKVEEAINCMAEFRDNYGVLLEDSNNRIEQQDTGLSDLDVTIMTQYQIVAGQSGIPATKLMGTSPKGFNATGEHEIDSYHEELESIQENDLTPIVNRHHVCLMRSHIAPRLEDKTPLTVEIIWQPLAVMTAREQAETSEIKSRTYKTLQDAGAIDSYDIRDAVIADEDSGLSGMESVERPEDLDDVDLPEFGIEMAIEEIKEEGETGQPLTAPGQPPSTDQQFPKTTHTSKAKPAGGSIKTEAEKTQVKATSRRGFDLLKMKNGRWFVISEEGEKVGGPFTSKTQAERKLVEIADKNKKGR